MDEPLFQKQLGGSTTVFQPDNLADYADDPWDIRISLGDAPLEDAFYFTVGDPTLVRRSIRELLERHALNPELAGELDIETYPELPALQAELREYYQAGRDGRLDLKLHVNHRPDPTPVRLSDYADKLLCVCTFDDGSFDYRVLDLIFVTEVPEQRDYDLDRARREQGPIFLMLLFGYYRRVFGTERLAELLTTEPFRGARDRLASRDDSFPGITGILKQLDYKRWLERVPLDPGGGSSAGYALTVTETGFAEITRLEAEGRRLLEAYDRYRSVWLDPPALGVPDGFDVRLQLMAQDGLDLAEAILLYVLTADAEEWFESDWAAGLESGETCRHIHGLLAYRTTFTEDVLARVRSLSDAAEEESPRSGAASGG